MTTLPVDLMELINIIAPLPKQDRRDLANIIIGYTLKTEELKCLHCGLEPKETA